MAQIITIYYIKWAVLILHLAPLYHCLGLWNQESLNIGLFNMEPLTLQCQRLHVKKCSGALLLVAFWPWAFVQYGPQFAVKNHNMDSGCWKFLFWIDMKLFYQFTFNGTFICDARNFISVSDWQLLNKTRVNLMLCLFIANVSNLNFEGLSKSFFNQILKYVGQKNNPNVA